MNTEKYNFRKSRILIIIVVLSTMIINGCLTLPYYPAKVAKPGKMYLGLGLHEEGFEGWDGDYIGNLTLFNAIFLRYGLPYNFDIGFDIQSILIFPNMITISSRKQFDLNNDLIHSITFDLGFGISFLEQYCASVSLIRDDFALTFGLKKYSLGGDLMIVDPTFLFRNEFLIKISKEFKYKRFNIMPILYYKAVQEYREQYNDFQTYLTYIERTGWNNKQIGIGISFYFDLL